MFDELRREFERLLGVNSVISDPAGLRTYECDGLTGYRVVPRLVLLPRSKDEVAQAVRICARDGISFVARGAGTGLSGGALPEADGIVISLQRLGRILHIDADNHRAVVEPGVINLDISRAVAEHGLYFAPDPSSQQVCTIGGNFAENSGGAHCLKYGFTLHHILGATVVLPNGMIVELGSGSPMSEGYDLLGVLIGSEGTLGIVVEIVVNLLPKPAAVKTLVADFDDMVQACRTVSEIIASGIIPAAIELMDTLAIEAVEVAVGAGYSRDSAAALIVELDGPAVEVETQFREVCAICARRGTTGVRIAADPAERAMIWKGRKAAFAAMGRISPNYFVQDGVVPRTRLAEALARIVQLGAAASLRVANVFHAGDGNLHPLVLYSEALGEHDKAEELSTRIAELCVELGGSLSGEHGIGSDKACSMPRQFTPEDLAVMRLLREAFDPDGISNPNKVLPSPRLCGELPGPYRRHPLEAAGIAERM